MSNAMELDPSKSGQRVKVNFCSPRELMSLPGVGRKTCNKLLEIRETKGNIDELSLYSLHLRNNDELFGLIDFEPYAPMQIAESQAPAMTEDSALHRKWPTDE